MFSPLTHQCLSAVNQLVNAPLALRVDSGLSAPGPGPPAARSFSSSESSGMMHPQAAALPAPSQRLAPARIAAGRITAGSGPSYPSQPGSMLNVRQMSAGPPSLPFSIERMSPVKQPSRMGRLVSIRTVTSSQVIVSPSCPATQSGGPWTQACMIAERRICSSMPLGQASSTDTP